MADTGDKVTRKYSGFRGVDLRGEECDFNRSPDSLNMWRNYANLSSIETRPALKKLFSSGSCIRSMKWYKGKLYFIEGDGSLMFYEEGKDEANLITASNDFDLLFEFGGGLYVKSPDGIYKITPAGTGAKVETVDPFVPTTTIGRKPSGGGTPYQDVNLLTKKRKNSFVCDGVSKTFYLDAKNIGLTSPEVELDVNSLLFNVDVKDIGVLYPNESPDYEYKIKTGIQTLNGVKWFPDLNTKKEIVSAPQPGYIYLSTDTEYDVAPTSIAFAIKNLPSIRGTSNTFYTYRISDINTYGSKLNFSLVCYTNKSVINSEGKLETVDEVITITPNGTETDAVGQEIKGLYKIAVWVSGNSTNVLHKSKISFKLEIVDANNNFEVNHNDGTITFPGAPPPPLTDGQDNFTVTFESEFSDKNHAENKAKIFGSTIVQEFDGRLFFSGNPNYPNTIWHSALNDVSYFSDLDYYVDGTDDSPIRSMVAGNNGLWVFRDTQTAKDGVFYHTPAMDDSYGKIYPSSHSSVSLGCSGRAINFNDDIVFFSPRGMEGISTDISSEQFATHRSSLVDRLMANNVAYKDMILAEWQGYLMVFVGNDVFLADSRAVLQNENHVEYEWFHWDLKRKVTCVTVHDGVLYVAMDGDGDKFEPEVFSLSGDPKLGDEFPGKKPNSETWGTTSFIQSYWITPKDQFNAPNKLKSTNKKGCVTEAIGKVKVSVKTDEDTSFEEIGEVEDVKDYFVSRIKRKKFKDIQLKFESDTSFRLESSTIEAFIGGYIKR